jgi:flagellar biogenesis protein FliO
MPVQDGIWTNTLVQLAAILAIAALLYAIRRFSPRRRPVLSPVTRPLAA